MRTPKSAVFATFLVIAAAAPARQEQSESATGKPEAMALIAA
jgi:hypothetical protein